MTSTQQPTPPSSAAEAETPRPPRAAIVTLCAGGLSASLTQTMVIPVQARFPELLSTSAANATWVITITFLAAAVSMPITGRLADMLGKQRVLVGCAVSLLIGAVLCALGDSLLPVLVGRGLQGVSMGFIPVGIALLREIVPPRYASTSIAAMSATLGVGGAIGLPLAAWIVQEGSWHALFWVSAGVAAAMLTALLTFVPHVHDASPGRFDLPGAVGLATGLTLVLVALSKGGEWGWGSAATLGSLAVGVVVLLAWGVFEMRVDQPLVALRSMARLPVLLTNLAAVVVGLGLMAQALVVPRLLQLPDTLDYGLGQSMLPCRPRGRLGRPGHRLRPRVLPRRQPGHPAPGDAGDVGGRRDRVRRHAGPRHGQRAADGGGLGRLGEHAAAPGRRLARLRRDGQRADRLDASARRRRRTDRGGVPGLLRDRRGRRVPRHGRRAAHPSRNACSDSCSRSRRRAGHIFSISALSSAPSSSAIAET